uniref:Cadherin domain-containing protein n=1 Tax=Astyanax mexicanus TaxID=7994 RepID=A0A8B9JGT1_ASTMX
MLCLIWPQDGTMTGRFWIVSLCWIGLCCQVVMSGHAAYSVFEEVSPGTVVGNLAKDLSLNVADLEARKLRIKKHFDVDLKTGVLFVLDVIDREQLCPNSLACTETLEAIVNDPLQMHSVEIKILDTNDHSPVFPGKSQTIRVAESALVGSKFPLLGADDPDIGINSISSYKLSQNAFFNLEVHTDADQGPSAELVLLKSLDRERQATFRLVLTAVDGGRPPRSGTTEIHVVVLDANDNAPAFSKSVYKVSVPENTAIGTSVLKVNATDLDEDVHGEVKYSFKQGQKGISDTFSIDFNTGEISLIGELDYESTGAYEIRVEARDGGSTPLASHCKVLVEVVDVNDNAPEIKLSSLLDSVPEDSRKGTVIALITVQDKDGGKNGKVHCFMSKNSPFVLESTQGKYYSLVLSGALDREEKQIYNVSITAIDEGTPPLSSTTVVTVRVSDVNDNPPRFPEASVNVYVKENSPAGGLIAVVSAHDIDGGENSRITYSLFHSSGISLSASISINSVTGEMYSMQSFNYEEIKHFQFQVQATDSGTPPLSSNVTLNVFILDENDNNPVILPPYSEAVSVNTENIPYSAEAGYFVAKIRAVDADSGYNALLSYHVTEPKGSNLFRVGTSSGEIRTKRRMSDNDLKTHPLIITVCDHGEPSLSATVSVDVVVVERVESVMQPSLREVPMKEEGFSDLNLYLLIAIVSVSVIFLLSLITLIAAKCYRSDDPFSTCSPPVVTTHPDGSWSYSKSTQQYDVCFSSDTLKSDVVVFPSPFPPVDAELISINGGDTFTRTQTLPSSEKVKSFSNPLGVAVDRGLWLVFDYAVPPNLFESCVAREISALVVAYRRRCVCFFPLIFRAGSWRWILS